MLPVDQHELVAMVAPRGLFIMENPSIDWLAARSGSVSALGGAEVYKALGVGDNISYWSDVQDGTHCAVRSEWRTPLQQNLQKFLLKTGSSAGVFRISSRKAGNLADWRDWTTPTLSDGPTSPPPTSPTSPPPTSPTSPPPTSPTSPPPTSPTGPPPTTSPPPTGAGCSASALINQWTGGFTATVRVTAGAAQVNGWTVTLTLASGATIVNAWNANRSGNTGTIQFTNVSYNGSIAPGQSTEFGFQANGNGTGISPTCSAR
jgi:cellulase/cellobiase CelA1